MQVIFRDISKESGINDKNSFNEEDVFIETVYEKFDQITNEFNGKNSLITNESEGISRIFEIIECTMWSEMVLFSRFSL